MRIFILKAIEFLLKAILWVTFFLCPTLGSLAISLLIIYGMFGASDMVENWRVIVVASLASSMPFSVYVTEVVRKNYGLLELYSKLLNNKELNK
jgi:hypothetical protein